MPHRTAGPRAILETLLNAEGISRVNPPVLLPADPYFDLAGEEFGQRLLLTVGADGVEYCLRPDFTLPIAQHYLASDGAGSPAAFSYHGPAFRQRQAGPAEFNQAGLELIGQRDAFAALDRVLVFASGSIAAFGLEPRITFGSVEMFEKLLNQLDMPDVWRPRIRHRFGHPLALGRLLDRLENRTGETETIAASEAELADQAAAALLDAGMSLDASRSPEEIAARMFEKQALAAAHVPGETIAILRAYLAIAGDLDPALADVEKLAKANRIDLDEQLASLRKHASAVSNFPARFKAGFSPRLDYYTGLVFEMLVGDDTILASGGQYDRLMQRLGARQKITASGCAVWVDRLAEEAIK